MSKKVVTNALINRAERTYEREYLKKEFHIYIALYNSMICRTNNFWRARHSRNPTSEVTDITVARNILFF